MKKISTIIFLLLVISANIIVADDFKGLWKDIDKKRSADMPASAVAILDEVIGKAEGSNSYGSLIKAVKERMELRYVISPDSFDADVINLENHIKKRKKSDIMYALYNSLLGGIYSEKASVCHDYAERKMLISKADSFYTNSLSNPNVSAAINTNRLFPFFSKQKGTSLLISLSYKAGMFDAARDYYISEGNRRSALIMSLESLNKARNRNKNYLASLDSLIRCYEDLDECCAAATARYRYLNEKASTSSEEKIRYVRYALKRWGGYRGSAELKNEELLLTRPSFEIETRKTQIAEGDSLCIKLKNVRNVKKITARIWRTRLTSADIARAEADNKRGYDFYKSAIKGLRKKDAIKLSAEFNAPDYALSQDSITTPALKKGIYVIETFCSNKHVEPAYAILHVSNLFVVSEQLSSNSTRFAAIDIKEGQPIADASFTILSRNSSRESYAVSMKCDNNGEAVSESSDRAYAVFASSGDDKFMPVTRVSRSYGFNAGESDSRHTAIFTDRAVYRPGQTVKVGAVAYTRINNSDLRADSGAVISLTLKDSRYNTIGSREIVSDSYGKASAEFKLPKKILSGVFVITDGHNGYNTIRVEEYKRPSFDIKLTSPETAYKIGDTVRIKGEAENFSGFPAQDAKVRYEVKRTWYPWLRFYSISGSDVVSAGSTITSADGSFNIDVPLTAGSEKNSGCYYFTTEVFVTDAAGETQSSRILIPVSGKKLWFSCNLPERIEKSSEGKVKFSLQNITGKEVSADVMISVDGRREFSVKSNSDILINDIISCLPPGLHKIKARANGEEISREFVLFSINDKKPAAYADEWFYLSSDTFSTSGDSILLQIGSSDSNVHVMYSVLAKDKVIAKGTETLNDEIKTYRIKYRDEYGDGILVSYAWVKNGEIISRNISLKKPLPDKKLRIKWTSFRNRLTPGQDEEWKMHISLSDGSKADASVIAALYDMSLENIARHEWKRVCGLYRDIPQTRWTGTYSNDWQRDYSNSELRLYDTKAKTYEQFPQINLYGRFSTPPYAYHAVSSQPRFMENKTATRDAVAENVYEEERTEANESSVPGIPLLRKDFSETAFFYPSLKTDEDGDVTISFRLPESVTTWKFMAFANDKQMSNEVFESIAVASREMMVQPIMPRFIRRGDKASISARIQNLSDKDIAGKAVMQLCNPENDSVILERTCSFDVKRSASGKVEFSFDAITSEDIVICRIFAESNDFRDGEQHCLMVLSDKEQVTRTRTITLKDRETLNVDAKDLFDKGATNSRFMFEYTENPKWLAIQALPYVAGNNADDAISTASRIYAAGMARHIAKASPAAKTFVEKWKQNKDRDSMTSRLQDNAEIKDIALEETPWIADALNDTERMQRIGELLDDSLNNEIAADAAGRLMSLQMPDGSWGWWKGMKGSRHITLSVAEMLLRLEFFAEIEEETKASANKAMNYLSKEVSEELNRGNNKKNERITTFQLRYLYLETLRKCKADDETIKVLLERLDECPASELSIYEKSMAAVICNNYNRKDKARDLVKSIKEHTVFNTDMGRYFDSGAANYSWCDYKIPSQVMAIEAMRAVTPDDSTAIAEMVQWLIQEKRTTSWDTPVNSVNAIYAITKGGSEISASDNADVIKLNGKIIRSDMSASGYVSGSSEGYTADLSINKKSSGMSWLSMYGSYTADVTDVSSRATGLQIKREIIADESKDISVGSIVKVKLTITADRDYDFVQITDRRAACIEPVNQISGFIKRYYYNVKDNASYYYFDKMPKGTHVIETEYYISRKGKYKSGSCKVQCAYSPEFRDTASSYTMVVK